MAHSSLVPRKINHGTLAAIGPRVVEAMARIVPPDRLRVTRIQMAWPEIAPPTIVQSCWPASVLRDILTLVVRDNQWLHELVYLQSDLLRRIRGSLPHLGIAHLRMRVGTIPARPPLEPVPRDGPTWSLPDEPGEPTRAALLEVSDPHLRQLAANARLAMTARVRRRGR